MPATRVRAKPISRGPAHRLRQASILTAIVLCGWAHGAWSAGAGGIYTWTDTNGVIHFSDAPPAPGSANQPGAAPPIELGEDTPVPATLNELLSPATAASIHVPGEGSLPTVAPERSSVEAHSIEDLEALDPVWFRGSGAAPDMRADQYGPFTIGELIEDPGHPPEERCRWARRDLEVLRDSWPVYRDQGGRLRFQWARDPYRGARRYLDDEARTAALAGVRQTLRRDCATPDDPGAQLAARDELMRGALCEAERAELAAMESLGGNNPTLSLPEKRTLVGEVCGEPATALTRR